MTQRPPLILLTKTIQNVLGTLPHKGIHRYSLHPNPNPSQNLSGVLNLPYLTFYTLLSFVVLPLLCCLFYHSKSDTLTPPRTQGEESQTLGLYFIIIKNTTLLDDDIVILMFMFYYYENTVIRSHHDYAHIMITITS